MRWLLTNSVLLTLALSGCQSLESSFDKKSTIAALIPQDKKAVDSSLPAIASQKNATPTSGSIYETTVASTNSVSPSVYTPPKTGTVFSWRNNWASLPKIIKYKVAGTETIGSKNYIKFTSVAGLNKTVHAYYDLENFNLKGYRGADGAALVTYKPVEQRYRFPMKPGDTWITSWHSMEHKKKKVLSGGGVVKVVRYEIIKLPAGKYWAYKIRLPLQRGAPKGMTHHIWFVPKLGVTAKEQIRSGAMNWTQILEKVEYPTS